MLRKVSQRKKYEFSYQSNNYRREIHEGTPFSGRTENLRDHVLARAIIQRYFTSRSYSSPEEKWRSPVTPRRNSFWQISYIELMFICRVRRKISRMEKCIRSRARRLRVTPGQNFDHSVAHNTYNPSEGSNSYKGRGQRQRQSLGGQL